MTPLLIIDDDAELCALLTEFLAREGFSVVSEHDGQKGLDMALEGDYALVVLDLMLPSLDGFAVMKQLRARSRVPALMLTARGEDVDRIVGLELGADDYLAKPFNPRELVARIRAILRRLRTARLRGTAGDQRRDYRSGCAQRDLRRARDRDDHARIRHLGSADARGGEGGFARRADGELYDRKATPFDRSSTCMSAICGGSSKATGR